MTSGGKPSSAAPGTPGNPISLTDPRMMRALAARLLAASAHASAEELRESRARHRAVIARVREGPPSFGMTLLTIVTQTPASRTARLAGVWRSGPPSGPGFRLLTFGQFASTIGDYCYAVALPGSCCPAAVLPRRSASRSPVYAGFVQAGSILGPGDKEMLSADKGLSQADA